MSTDDGNTDRDDSEGMDGTDADTDDGVRDRLEGGADKAIERFDGSVVDLLSWILDTETRARIFVYLRQNPHSTSDEIAEGTGLYPSTVREALAELHDEGKVDRRKRESGGAGNNPYEYTAMAPSDLVTDVVGDVQAELNTVFNLDSHLGENGTEDTVDEEPAGGSDPVTITVDEEPSDES